MLMDLRCAAFGLDLRNASRVYFLHPVLDTQVEAQAIGRARRICQTKDVTVETLVLKDSFEAFLVERRQQMTAGEQRQCKSILDDKPIKEFIENAGLIPLPETEDEGLSQTAMLKEPQFVFGRTFARAFMRGVDNPDEDLVALPSPTRLRAVRAEEPPSVASDAISDDIQYEKKAKRPRKRTTSVAGISASKRKRVGFAAEPSSASGSSTTPTTPSSASNGTEIVGDIQPSTVAVVRSSIFGA
jgi:superfamily II DNA or RNA helicase